MKIDKYDLSYLAGLGLYNINEETTEAGLKIVQIMKKLEELKRHKKTIKILAIWRFSVFQKIVLRP